MAEYERPICDIRHNIPAADLVRTLPCIRHHNQGDDPGRLKHERPRPRAISRPAPAARLPGPVRAIAKPALPRQAESSRQTSGVRRAGHKNSFRFRHHDAELLAEGGVEIVDVVKILAAVVRRLAHAADADQVEDDLAEIARAVHPQLPSTSLAM